MDTFIMLYSNYENEIKKFINYFDLNTNYINAQTLEYKLNFKNPVEMADIIGIFIENKDLFKINMWICIDQDVLINVTESNVNDIIKYLYERFPY